MERSVGLGESIDPFDPYRDIAAEARAFEARDLKRAATTMGALQDAGKVAKARIEDAVRVSMIEFERETGYELASVTVHIDRVSAFAQLHGRMLFTGVELEASVGSGTMPVAEPGARVPPWRIAVETTRGSAPTKDDR